MNFVYFTLCVDGFKKRILKNLNMKLYNTIQIEDIIMLSFYIIWLLFQKILVYYILYIDAFLFEDESSYYIH